MRVAMSCASHARLKFLTGSACWAAGASRGRRARMRRRAEEAGWRQAGGVRSVISAISVKE
ncbi:hypothetical protein DV517_63610 [Streptomyces sp. S816]|nr:hypothetical protein DV517_63610 [Streptomyces sp. S816]